MRDDKVITISIRKQVDSNKRTGQPIYNSITLRDSLLLLPFSLDKLGKSFGVGSKIEFDFNTFNQSNIKDPEVKEALLSYNLSDCVLLYNIISEYSKQIFDLFMLNIHNYPTLSSLSFAIYRSIYLEKENIPVTSLDMYNKIKPGYIGGAVDVYRTIGKLLYYYDVNSLYPFVMKSNPYPVGRGIYFKGNRPLSEIFGLVYCKVTTPTNIFAPILLTRKGDSTIAPTGSWSGWYFTEELKNAEKYGYSFEVFEGYHWSEKAYIFTGFVDTLYKLRLSYKKGDPRNLICKLIMNSLYGRFGLSPVFEDFYFEEQGEKELVNRIDLKSNSLYSYNKLNNINLSNDMKNVEISTPSPLD